MATPLARRVFVVLLLPVCLVLLGFGGGGENSRDARAVKPVSGEFVDSVDSPGRRVSVAVVVERGKDVSGERAVKVYVCDSAKVSVWFTGVMRGNTVSLTSKDGKARVRLSLSNDSASGKAELPTGRSVAFTAPRATGAAGLFTTTHTKTGDTGISTRGVRLKYRATKIVNGKVRRETLELRLPDGREVRLQFVPMFYGSPGEYRIIVSPNHNTGQPPLSWTEAIARKRIAAHGSKVLPATTTGGTNFSWRCMI